VNSDQNHRRQKEIGKHKIPIWILCFGLVVLCGSFAVHSVPRLDRGLRAAISKVKGDLNYVSWGELVREITPHQLRSEKRWEAEDLTRSATGEKPCSVLWSTPLGSYWGREDDREALAHALTYREVDELFLQGPSGIRKGDIVFDGGSHLGTFTRLALERGAQTVIAIDADPTTMMCFKKTFSTEIAAGQVVAIEAALWNKSGEFLVLTEEANSLNTSVHAEGKESQARSPVRIPTITIDETVRSMNIKKVDFIKLNIEGAEREALLGAVDTIRLFHPRIKASIEHSMDDPWLVPRFVLGLWPSYHVRTQLLRQAFFY